MISTTLFVAFGGALGAVLRYLSGIGMVRLLGQQDFPLATLSVNIVGSFLMGLVVVAASERGLTHFNPFVMTGLLGGFTTFSAFSLDTVTLIEQGAALQAALYVVLSVALSVGALVLGLIVAKGVFA
ncbi:fluoride efflux transporter CrcB [Pontibaca salina]|uniref:Fluoride-specific ion channel FluC n=1 Tax=Pontibaca salina TaxID=2795731 RepID=A0A934HNL4_9RHOB|nr:fluoride efflux transporter CrcB [Pontibaca salina]MBI6630301.1 fluoride efflux transporter CrcB [Pontibaca salina]